MPPPAVFFVCAVLFAPTAAPASALHAGWEPAGESWYNVTLVGVDGHSLSGLRVQWLTNGARLRATRSGGAYRDYQPEEIRELRTGDGDDLTDLVAAARPGGPGRDDERRILGRNRDPKIFSQSFDIGFGYAMILGEWFAGMDHGLNAQVGFRAGLSGRNYLRLLYRHQLADMDPAIDPVDSVVVDLDGAVDELILSVGTALTDIRQGAFAVAEIGAGVLSRRVSSPDTSERVYEFAAQLGLLTMLPLDQGSAVELGASLTIKPSFMGPEGTGGTLIRAYVGYSFVGW